MSAQNFLTFLFDAMPKAVRFATIALSFLTIATIDFTTGLMPRLKISSISPGQLNLFVDHKPELLPLLPDPWILPLDEAISRPQHQHFSVSQSKPLLLLPPAKEAATSSVPITAELTLDELFLSIDIDKLQLRLARKIAKALGIFQKVNGRDQKLSWLRAQIKAKLQHPQELHTTAILAVRDLLAN